MRAARSLSLSVTGPLEKLARLAVDVAESRGPWLSEEPVELLPRLVMTKKGPVTRTDPHSSQQTLAIES